MCLLWSWILSVYGTTRATSESAIVVGGGATVADISYVHRLIQTRTDGKLVELPSASSLVTPSMSRPLPLSNAFTPQRPSHASATQTSIAPGSSITQATQNGANGTTHPISHSHTHSAGPSTDDVEKMSTRQVRTNIQRTRHASSLQNR